MAGELPARPEPEDTSTAPVEGGHHGGALAALAASSLAAPILYKMLRTRHLSADPALRAIQEKAKGQFTRVMPGTGGGRFERWLDRLLYAGGGKTKYVNEIKGDVARTPGAVLHHERTGPEYLRGDVNVAANKATRDVHDIVKNDKWREYQLFNKYAPGSMGRTENMADVLKALGHDAVPADPQAQAKLLSDLQAHLKTQYGKGFLLKDTVSAETKGYFPTEKHDFNKLLADYRASGVPDEQAKVLASLKARGLGKTDEEWKKHRVEWRDRLGDLSSGRVLHQLFEDPRKVIVQEKLPLDKPTGVRGALSRFLGNPESKEIRVHVENGAVVPGLTVPRFDPTMFVADRPMLHGAEDFVRQTMGRMPSHLQKGTYAMDIAPLAGGGYKMIESNPSGKSGFFSPKKHPFVGPLLHRHLTGQWSPTIAGAGAVAGAGAAGLGAYGVARHLQQPDEPQGPAGPPQLKAAQAAYKLGELTDTSERARSLGGVKVVGAGLGASAPPAPAKVQAPKPLPVPSSSAPQVLKLSALTDGFVAPPDTAPVAPADPTHAHAAEQVARLDHIDRFFRDQVDQHRNTVPTGNESVMGAIVPADLNGLF